MLIRLFAAVCLFLAAEPAPIKLPADYREWVFLSAGLGMNYGPAGTPAAANPAFDNVFVNRAAYSEFLKSGAWPDKTMFVLEIRASQSEGSINHGGHYQTALSAVEAEVKENGVWTFYGFGGGAEGKPFPRTERCYSCHAQNGAVDNTFVQFYPTLLPIAKEKGTYKEPKAELRFTPHTIAADLTGGYQVVAADMNRDGKPDLIALASGMRDLVWFENPTWERHTIASDLPHMINCAPEDLDGDGIPELVIAWEFNKDAAQSLGKVGVLKHDGDPRQPWKLTEIDRVSTSHRIRWADPDGSGKKVAINAVLTGAHATAPGYTNDHAPLLFYRPGEWRRQLIGEDNLGVQHGLSVVKWNAGDKRDSLLTASFSGIDLYQLAGGRWARTELAKGDPSACPKCGSSDVSLGHRGGEKFLAAIEPWHGNQVAVYTGSEKQWTRQVIDDSLIEGHTILTADLDRDGRDEIVAGFRGGSKQVFIYRAGLEGAWTRQVLDNTGAGASSCVTADLNRDHTTDIACISAGALKWYENNFVPVSH